MKFKIGDRVIAIDPADDSADVLCGSMGLVVGVQSRTLRLKIHFDDYKTGDTTNPMAYPGEWFMSPENLRHCLCNFGRLGKAMCQCK